MINAEGDGKAGFYCAAFLIFNLKE